MSRPNTRKWAEWQDRLSRYQTSGLSVAQFCRNEGVGPHTFYYWDKRVGRKSNDQARVGKSGDRARGASEASCPLVHFRWGSKVQISIPANCVDAIRCVLEQAADLLDEPAAAFRQVVVTEG